MGGVTIPLPALDVRPPQQPDLMGQLAKVGQIKGQQQEQQLRAQQMQSNDLGLQQQQLSLDSQKALQKAYLEANGDPGKTIELGAKYGAKPQELMAFQNAAIEQKKNALALVQSQGAKAKNDADLMQGAYEQLEKAKPEDRPTLYPQLMQGLQRQMVDISQAPAQYPGDAALKYLGIGIKSHSQAVDEAFKQAETAQKNSQAASENATAQQKNAQTDAYRGMGLIPGLNTEEQSMMSYMRYVPNARPDHYPAWKAQQEAAITQPYKIQTAKEEALARQQAAQGDPNAAGAMLAKGDLTLADLKSRGTTPQYITQAVAAAQKVNPDYKPADEVIAEQVAKSPAANQFFGSANSLINKGGTLDQLANLSKQIPEHDYPVLNTVDDWQKLARGKGPLAGYAATALGAADDYGKVMGGGTASDSAREHALSLFSKAASPEQRAAAIAATRNAVISQRDSRIGKNQFLKRQYGEDSGGAQTDPFAQFGGARKQ